MKENELYRFTRKALKWYSEHADECWQVAGDIKVRNTEELMHYGVDRFSLQNNLDIFVLIEGDNGYSGDDFAYKVYFFNELGYGWCWMSPDSLKKL